ncbi:hypothetical protein PYW08_009718 [Mythimna loreyi]|uniref:Uncharacterized protein n=1 Tax=Mythimna loreyi TaxID=667449 RepID=A0ACC2Q9D2_9NEOP|nr:hypothetical protein PYW08_009718 [Mythimna loreyi]
MKLWKLLWKHGVSERKMAKFFKSIFHTTDRRKAPHYRDDPDVDEDRSESPQAGSKRQLSISRSGRMRQYNKKRNSLTLELYGETISIDAVEKPQAMEYHVNAPSHTAPAVLGSRKSRFGSTEPKEVKPKEVDSSAEFAIIDVVPLQSKLSTVAIDTSAKSPDEEIDLAFEIIDKS